MVVSVSKFAQQTDMTSNDVGTWAGRSTLAGGFDYTA